MTRLLLIDGNAMLHRAFHALPPLTAPDGSVINAMYGFASMTHRLTLDLKPTHVAVAFDRPAPTFRKKLYKQYQASRPKMDDLLSPQIPKLYKLIEAFGIPMYGVDGFEADDVMGTIAKNVTTTKDKKLHMDKVVIVTGDRDILQLVVDEKILVYMPTKGLSEGKLYSEKDVIERMGVTPNKIADFKALAGDSSDNYPGVVGIGPKTAINLLTTFGSIESLYEALKKNTPKIQSLSAGTIEKLKNGSDDAILSKNLATIRCDVPVPNFVLPPFTSLNTPEARAEIARYEFQTLFKRITGEELFPTAKTEKKPKEKKKETAGEQLSLV